MAQYKSTIQPTMFDSSPIQISRYAQRTPLLTTSNKSTKTTTTNSNFSSIGKVKLRNDKSLSMSMSISSPSSLSASSSKTTKHPYVPSPSAISWQPSHSTSSLSKPLFSMFSSVLLLKPLWLLLIVVFGCCCLIPTIESLPASRHLSTGSAASLSNSKILIWPNEIENNALTEHQGDFVYKQHVSGVAKQQQSQQQPPQPKNNFFYWPGSTGQHIRSANGRNRGGGSRSNGPVIEDGFLGFQPEQAFGNLHNSAPPPPSSTVFLWPSLSPSSPSGSTTKIVTLFQQPLCLICLALNWIFYQFWKFFR